MNNIIISKKKNKVSLRVVDDHTASLISSTMIKVSLRLVTLARTELWEASNEECIVGGELLTEQTDVQ